MFKMLGSPAKRELLFRKSKFRIMRLLRSDVKHSFLIILAPPFSGSTLLTEYLSRSQSISVNNTTGTMEGQSLPEVKHLLFDNPEKWSPEANIDWNYIHKQWNKYWDPRAAIRMDKSPPNIVRAQALQDEFNPAFFIVYTRSPFALAEGYSRRTNKDIRQSARRVKFMFEYQYDNYTSLASRLHVRYEDIVAQPEGVMHKVQAFLPDFIPPVVHREQVFDAHNHLGKGMPLTDFNQRSLERLTIEQVEIVKQELSTISEKLKIFGYSLEV